MWPLSFWKKQPSVALILNNTPCWGLCSMSNVTLVIGCDHCHFGCCVRCPTLLLSCDEHKPPLIKWAYMHKLWEKLETAAFSPKLLQIGWPPKRICKESLPKWPSEGHSPQPSQGGRGEVPMSVWAHCWALVLDAFFGMLFQMQFLSLRTLFWSLWAPILDHFGLLFCSFQLSK